MRPLILLTAGFETVRGMDQRQLFQNYADAVYQAGGQPLLALGADRELADMADGLFLTGGVLNRSATIWKGEAGVVRRITGGIRRSCSCFPCLRTEGNRLWEYAGACS